MYQKLLEIVNDNNPIIKIRENLIEFVVEVTFNDISNKDSNFYKSILKSFDYGDKVNIDISSQFSSKAILRYDTDVYEFLKKLDDEIIKSKDNDEKYILNITISRNESNEIFNIYNLDSFMNYMNTLSILEQFKFFEKNREDGVYKFRLVNIEDELITNTFIFSNKLENHTKSYKVIEREEILEKRNLNSSVICGEKLSFIPEDFKIIIISKNKLLNNLIRKLELISSIIFISNVSVFKDVNELNCRIIGYKTLSIVIDKDKHIDDIVINQLYNIYSWVYSSPNISDKIGLSRNILSLGLSENLDAVSNDLYESINTAHEIYLQENIKEYLDVKAKVTEFIFDLTQKTSELASGICKALFNNIITVITFFATIVIMNSFSENRLENIFTKDITYISLALWIGSIVYMIISTLEILFEFKRYKQVYYRVKNSYDDVLNSQDIDKVFKNDIYLNEDRIYVIKKSIVYLIFWVVVLAIMIILLYKLGYNHIKPIIINLMCIQNVV